MTYPINKISSEIQQINFQGNVIPASWKTHMRLGSKPDLVGMWVLSEIVYWYRPVVKRDDFGCEVYERKYSSDFLQKSYAQLEESLGLTKKQAQEALSRLERLGLVKRHFRTIYVQIPGSTDTRPNSNVMFIEIFPEKLKEITYSQLKKSIPLSPAGNEGVTCRSLGVDPQVMTYTETTSKTNSSETKGIDSANEKSLPFLEKKGTMKEKQKFPLKKDQKHYLEKMLDLDLGVPEDRLVAIIRKYTKDEKNIKLLKSAISHVQHEISKGTKFLKPRIAMFNSVLSEEILPVCELSIYNKKVAEMAKNHHGWGSLTISDKSVVCEKSNREISLNLYEKEFFNQLESLFELSKLY